MPTASIVMTVWGEPAPRLERVLRSLAEQEGLPDGLEVLVAIDPDDHLSRGGVQSAGPIHAVTVVDNPGGARSAGLNRALMAASTEWVCRVDARSVLAPDYVGMCIEVLAHHPEVGAVGGMQRPQVLRTTVQARGIARALANPWALGGASYRTGRRGGPVDTVYLGAFRRQELIALGGYNEKLDANEDFELCQRYRATGATVWLEPALAVGYEARDTLRALWSQYVAFGRSKVRFWRATGGRPNRRQWLAMAMAAGAGAGSCLAVARRPRSLVVLFGAFVGALAVLDSAVPGEPDGPPARMAAIPAYATVFAGWIGGIAVEIFRPRRP